MAHYTDLLLVLISHCLVLGLISGAVLGKYNTIADTDPYWLVLPSPEYL